MRDHIPYESAERSEAELMYELETSAPNEVKTDLGISSLRVGGGVVISANNDPSYYWSKALGFGFAEPVTADLIGEVCDFYRSHGTAMATLQLAPSVLPDDWVDICDRFELTAGTPWVKLAGESRTVAAAPSGPTGSGSGLRVRPVASADAATWAATVVRAFGLPESATGLLSSIVGRPRWRPFAAWDGQDVVAGGSVRIDRDVAQFFGAATLPHARGRGAQTALLAARARAAQAAGCRWLVSETGAEAPGEHNSSLHNMLQAGFVVLYERQNWIWRADRS